MADTPPAGGAALADATAAPAAVSGIARQTTHDSLSSSGDAPGPLREQTALNETSVACLIINKMIGTGIYTTPGIVLLLCGNKITALFLWIFGGIYSYLSIYIYLEYGLAWPYNGGEYFYISRIFPRPPLVFACSFAWVFVSFSTSVGNALNFAKFLLLTRNPNPNEWLQKFIACGIVVTISLLHYRTVNIGVYANNGLAFGKILFLLVLVAGGLIGVSRDGHNNSLSGLKNFGKTTGNVTAVNIVVAIFLVMYSYQGWENANYVTSEIRGDARRRKRILKRGAIAAITIVTLLYIVFNFFLFFLLDFDQITKGGSVVAADFAIKAFNGDSTMTRNGIYVCIALSAAGNLIGVIFTNVRVKRDIAAHKIIPFYRYFRQSSQYDTHTWDGLGTPTGGIMLHGLVTCITVAATPFFSSSSEGQTFVVNIYTYAHSVLGIALGIGLPFLKKRMDDNQTSIADEANADVPEVFTYNIFKNKSCRWAVALNFIAINSFLVIVPFISTNNTDGTPRRISTRLLPAVVLPMYLLGALAGIFIMAWTPRLRFKGSRGRTRDTWVPYNNRKWIVHYSQGLERQTLDEFWRRWRTNGEKERAVELRRGFAQPGMEGPRVPLGPMQYQAHGANAYTTGTTHVNGTISNANGWAVQPSDDPILPA